MKITKRQLRRIVGENIGSAISDIVFTQAPQKSRQHFNRETGSALSMQFSETDENDEVNEEEELEEAYMKITKKQLAKLVREVHGEVSLEKPAEGEVYGHGGKSRMAKSQLFQIATAAAELHDMLSEDDELPEWVQSKIAVIEDNLDAVFDHLEYKYREHLGGEEIDMDDFVEAQHQDEGDLNFTGDVGSLPGDEAFAVGYEAGKRNL